MKKLLFILIASLLLFSCSDDINESNLAKNTSAKQSINKNAEHAFMASSSMASSHFKVDFKSDFKVDAKLNNFDLNNPISQALIDSNSSDINKLEEQYPSIKSNLVQWSTSNNDNISFIVQNISLKYLRNYFLGKTDQASLDEIEFLLETLIEHEAIDIDVLGDAYVALLPQMSNSKKDYYFDYIKSLHDSEVIYITQKSIEYKNQFNQVLDENEKRRLMMNGKDIERRSKACEYIRDIMGIEL